MGAITDLHVLGRFYLFPLVSEVQIHWEWSVDASKSEAFDEDGYTGTVDTTVVGSGSGDATLVCSAEKVLPDNMTGPTSGIAPGEFRVYRRIGSMGPETHRTVTANHTLWGGGAEAGTYGLTETYSVNYDDTSMTDTETVSTITDDPCSISSVILRMGLPTVSVESINVVPVPYWVTPGTPNWTFDRTNLFVPQTKSLERTAEDFGFDTGSCSLSVTLTLLPWGS